MQKMKTSKPYEPPRDTSIVEIREQSYLQIMEACRPFYILAPKPTVFDANSLPPRLDDGLVPTEHRHTQKRRWQALQELASTVNQTVRNISTTTATDSPDGLAIGQICQVFGVLRCSPQVWFSTDTAAWFTVYMILDGVHHRLGRVCFPPRGSFFVRFLYSVYVFLFSSGQKHCSIVERAEVMLRAFTVNIHRCNLAASAVFSRYKFLCVFVMVPKPIVVLVGSGFVSSLSDCEIPLDAIFSSNSFFCKT
jgi:hypothetical protein